MAPCCSTGDASRMLLQEFSQMTMRGFTCAEGESECECGAGGGMGAMEIGLPLAPPLDLYMREDGSLAYIICLLPGAQREDINLEMSGNLLQISGKLSAPRVERIAGSFVHRECRFGTFIREVELERGTREDDIKSKYDAGTLVIEVPAREKSQSAFAQAQRATEAEEAYFSRLFSKAEEGNRDREREQAKSEGGESEGIVFV